MSEAYRLILRKLGLPGRGLPLQTLDSARLQILYLEGI